MGSWLVEPDKNLISRDGHAQRLENRLMQTLLFLAENQGRVVKRSQFFDSVWQGRVVNEEALSRAISLLRSALQDDARTPQYVKTVPGVGYCLISSVEPLSGVAPQPPVQSEAQANSIAVLPFVNLSDDPDNEYFSDGVSEEILNALANVSHFKVVGRTSSFAFKNKHEDIRVIGQSLGVSHVLEGSVRKSGNRIRTTAQLISTSDGYHLWSQTYDHDLQDIFAVQDEISGAVTSALKLELLGAAPKVAETTPDAYAAHLRGTFLLRSGELPALEKAVDAFKQALEHDPTYAPTWTALADTYWYQVSYGVLPRARGIGLADEACDRALELDGELVDALSCKANLCAAFHMDWSGSQSAINKALALSPGNARALLQAGNLAGTLGKFDESIAHLQHAISVDPLNITGHIWLALVLLAMDRLDEAEDTIVRAINLNPRRVVVNLVLARVAMARGDFEAAYERVLHEPEGFWRDCGIVTVQFAAGNFDEARDAFDALIETYEDEAPMQIAELYCLRGDPDATFHWLDKAYELRDNGLVHLLSSRQLRSARDDPRWQKFLRKMGLD